MSSEGTVVAGYGRDCLVQAGGVLVRAKARNRQVQPVAGDRVMLIENGIIEALAPRTSVFARAGSHRTKVIAANVTQIVAVAACEPPFSDELLSRFAIAAEWNGLPMVIVLNKMDLADLRAGAIERLAPFRDAGYPVVELAAARDAAPLRPLLAGHHSVLIGQSGMGKSTLLKQLVPEAEVHIQEISSFLAAGRQSTTASRLYPLDQGSSVIDTPGVAEFGLVGLDARAIAGGFREIAMLAARCKFSDCRHLAEPGCAVRNAIHPRRLMLYERIMQAERPA